MLPKKTFTMSYILKRAISKPKSPSLSSYHHHSISNPKTKKNHYAVKEENPIQGMNFEDSMKRPEFPIVSRFFGDVFLIKEEKTNVFLFGLINEVKKIREIVIKKANLFFEFSLGEVRFAQENLPDGLTELQELPIESARSLANIIEKYSCNDFESFFIELKQEIHNLSIKEDFTELFLNSNEKYSFMLHFELTSHGFDLFKVTFNGNFLELVHNVEEENLENVIKNTGLPNCLGFSKENYYEIHA